MDDITVVATIGCRPLEPARSWSTTRGWREIGTCLFHLGVPDKAVCSQRWPVIPMQGCLSSESNAGLRFNISIVLKVSSQFACQLRELWTWFIDMTIRARSELNLESERKEATSLKALEITRQTGCTKPVYVFTSCSSSSFLTSQC